MAYSTDADLIKIRPNIMALGVDDWSDMHNRAKTQIDQVLIARWYKTAASEHSLDYRDTEFDSDLVEDGILLDLSCYKTLELAYMYLMKDSPEPDGFERQMKLFRTLYNQELERLLAIGIGYDWAGDGAVTDTDKYLRVPRRLTRV